MSYLDSRRSPSLGSMAAVVAIHGAVGAALVLGLTVSGVIPQPDVPIPSFNFKKPPPPPTEPPKPAEPRSATQEPRVVTPVPPLPIPQPGPTFATTPLILPPALPPAPQPGNGEALKPAIPIPAPSFTPIGAKPRNDPLRWVTTEDYRGNWIRQEMTGRARFRLDIAADGRVTDCTITGSSGHSELDAATCALVTKRARFQPGRGAKGEPIASSYANAIDWRLPE